VTERAGCNGVEEVLDASPDVVVIDFDQPGCPEDGVQLSHRLRHDARTSDLPIILLAGSTRPEDEERVELAAVDRQFPKPCPPEALEWAVRQVLAERHRQSFQEMCVTR